MSEYIQLNFSHSNTGFLNNIYYRYCNRKKLYYCVQWDNGYKAPPILYAATKEGEASYPIKEEMIEYYIFPAGHEHYHSLLKWGLNG